ncbi:hypothetical protein KC19_8G131600 [Ceratodon purpureus]|uniref:Galactose oxidase n=1 Tax=Ceratodon purpureus TaxID=3225 RepID=A0A8T0H0P7_CERPU|nr:hypothetical protein KC19_N009800 [Ceratodon purpureus]KAG0504604.1 hypothetical protein KC19_N009900 [Ceratodon purpureus]KAG0564692.1 hypothetical protein KC19_8G131500 [Ceratodon purpureus]KAG0564693.1 hypothetical protein KC19_8G131600 [Ceratodon purpureus]
MARSMQELAWARLSLAIAIALQFHMLVPGISAQGTWQLLVQKAGIASMHTAITHYDTAILLDRTNIGASQIALPNGQCRQNAEDKKLNPDCTAHSVMLDTKTNKVRALWVQTDTWCSSGQFFADGTMVQTGGDFEGLNKIRRLAPCKASGTCDWVESDTEALTDGRWYASNQLLPDGQRQIVVGGRGANTYEFVPKRSNNEGAFHLQLLQDTQSSQDDNQYPFLHLLPDGNLFVFANRDSIVLDYANDRVVRTFPTIPGEPRNYPSAGSSVMLPLDHANGFATVEVLVCGGAMAGAFSNGNGKTWAASRTCGRMDVTAADPAWAMENMPMRRTMGDMVNLPTGDVLIINGARKGSQGWGKATDAVLTPVMYAANDAAARFQTLAAGTVPRVYHSTANLLSDGRILVAGSNTHQFYDFTGDFPTELRVEAYSPAYLAATRNNVRPTNVFAPGTIRYGRTFTVSFTLEKEQGALEVNLLSAPFVTHSYAMGQRTLKLQATKPAAGTGGVYSVTVTAPPNNRVAPASYYMLFVVQGGIPGKAVWVRLR